jgi:hypothetical protein
MLIKNGASVLKPASKKELWQRTVVAKDDNDRVLLVISDAVDLTTLVDEMLRLQGDLQILDALNLDGAYSSGLMYKAGAGNFRTVGNTKNLIGSAIVISRSR